MLAKRFIAALFLLFAAAPALAERDFKINGMAFSQTEILDARGTASLSGEPAILVTVSEKARAKLQSLSAAVLGKAITASLDGRTLNGPVVRDPIADGMIELTGFADFSESEAVAERISGKPPLPDSLEE
jgi:preprotein translocase subunit SecD